MEDMNTQLNNMDQQNNEDKDNKKKGRVKRAVKRGTGIAICAVLAGGLAAGAYEGVNRITGWNENDVVAATKEDNRAQLMQTKSDKESDGDSSDSKDEGSSGSAETKGSLDVSDIAEEAMKFVVSITTKSVEEVQNYYGYFGFGNGFTTQQEVEGSGSGIIVGENEDELLIATNNHVVEGADTLQAAFADGSTLAAVLKNYDSVTDLAVLSVNLADVEEDTLESIRMAELGSSKSLKAGEPVIAVGSPAGIAGSVKYGNLVASGYKVSVIDGEYNLLITDMERSEKGSGVLLNLSGQVIGLLEDSYLNSSNEGALTAYAISDMKDIIEHLSNSQDLVYMGIHGTDVTEEISEAQGIPAGVYVTGMEADSPAMNSGIQAGDIITEINGKTITSLSQIREMLLKFSREQVIQVVVMRQGKDGYKEIECSVTLNVLQ